MKTYFFLLCSLLLIFASCEKESNPVITPNPLFTKPALDLSDLQVGQRGVYVNYRTTCSNLMNPAIFVNDTLVVDVIENGGSLFLKEYFTPHSERYKDGWIEPNLIFVEQHEDFILLPERWSSALFFFYGNDTIHLNPEVRVPLHQEQCKLMHDNDNPFIGNDIGLLNYMRVGAFSYSDKTAVSCVPLIYDLDAYLVYDQKKLYLSHTIAEDPIQGDFIISGWRLIQ